MLFRYRYDTETGLYYLQSRYYNPEWGRFINVDAIVGHIGELLSHNIYSYCANEPINRDDPSGFDFRLMYGEGGLSKSGPISSSATTGSFRSSIKITNFKTTNYTLKTGNLYKGAGKATNLNPNEIHFMQSSIKNQTGTHTVLGNAEALKNGALKPTDLPSIKVWQNDAGKIWTLDHRRLASFRHAGLDEIPVQWATPDEIASQMWKMTTRNGGTSIRLKLGNGENMIIK